MILDKILLFLGYIFVGGGIKYVDQAFDEFIFPKKKALVIGLICGVIGGMMIAADGPTSIIFLSILLGLVITRKIDNNAFITATLICIFLIIMRVIFSPVTISIDTQIIPVIFLVSGAILDEIGNDMADKGMFKGFLEKFFLYRCVVKVVMFLMVISGFFELYYFFAFLSFDITYTLVEEWSWKVKEGKYRFKLLT